MVMTATAKNKGICSVALLSLTLLLAFISPPSVNYNPERQAVPTELISRPSSSARRIVRYPLIKKLCRILFFLSSQEIIRRLMSYEGKIKTEFSENLKPAAFADKLTIELLFFIPGNSQLSDSYVLRG
jgi:hypothetical protein